MNVKQAHALSSAALGVLSVAALLALFSVWGRGATVVRAQASDVYSTYYVALDCDGVPEPCYTTLQAAVDAVDAPADVIKVSAGRFTGVAVRQGVAQIAFISKTLAVQGGYTTAFAEPPDPAANATILDAEGEGRVIYITGGAIPTIGGLRITGGDADGLGGGRGPTEHAGGGIYAIDVSVTMTDCWVYSNTARGGGGLFLQDSDATLAGNSITSNTATTTEGGSWGDGGGLLALSTTVTMSRNLIRFNNAGFSGSGVYAESDSDVALINDVVADNWVDDDVFSFDCGIYVGSSSVTMLHTTIARNEGGEGTGVCVDTSTTTSTAALTNTIIADHVTGIDVTVGSQAVLRGTLWQGNGASSVGTVTRTDDRAGNPAFAPDGYHLTAQSAAIDQGVDTALTSDIDLEARPGGAGHDIGADEWQPNHYVDLAGFCNGLAPCHTTIGSAVGAARGGDSIYVFPGTYAESVNLSTMGSPGDVELFTVDATGMVTASTATVDPGAPGGPGTGQAFHNAVVPFPGDIALYGFTVDSPDADGIWLSVSSDVMIAHVTAITVGDGIDVDGSGDDGLDVTAQTGSITLTNSIFNGSFGKRGDGVDVQGVAGDLSIIGCTGIGNRGTEDNQGFEIEDVGGNLLICDTEAFNNDDDGFWIWDVDGNVMIDRVVTEENGGDGLYLDDSGDVTVRDSRATNNGGDGFALEWIDAVSVSHSTAFSNTWDGFWFENVSGDLSVYDSASNWNEEDGFDVESDENVRFSHVDVMENGWDGLWVWQAGGYVHIADTEASGNLGEGVYADATRDITITNSTANRNDRPGELSSGFVLLSDGDLLIQSCTANSNSDAGFDVFIDGQMIISDSVARGNGWEGVYAGDLGYGAHRVVGNVICDNEDVGLGLHRLRTVVAEGDWWGHASGPLHPTNPGGTGDGVEDGQNGGLGTVDFTPWIDTLAGEASVDPVIAGRPTIVSFGFSDQSRAFRLGPGPGDPNGPPPLTVSTDNGLLSDSDETAAEVYGFIGEPTGVFTVTLVPSTAGTATVTLDGPCGLDGATTVEVLPCTEPDGVTIGTPPTVTLGQGAAFTATISPLDVHMPVTFTWEATGQTERIHVRTDISDTQAYTWFVVGRQTLTVTAVNLCGSASTIIPVTVTNLAPIANAGPDQALQVNQVVTLDGSDSYDRDGHVPLDYGWTQTGGPHVTLSQATVVSTTFPAPATPSVLTFTLSVTDAFGLSSWPDTTVVTVGDVPIAGLEAQNSSPTTLGHVTHLFATVTAGGNVAYTWDYGDGYGGAGQTVSHTYGAAGTYTAVVTATNAAGEVSTTTPVTITNLAPIAVAGQDQGVLAGETVVLDGSDSYDPDGHDPLAYGWRQTGGPPVALWGTAAASATLTAPGAPTVLSFTLTVTDAYGLASWPDEIVVTVRDMPITGLAAENSSPTTLGQPTVFSATVEMGGNVIYQWAFGNHHRGEGQVVSHTYGAAGLYTAVVTAANAAGGVSATTVVTVTNLAPVAVAGPDQEVLTGETVAIDGSSSYDPDGHEPLLYHWTQIGGPLVALEDSGSVSTTFEAPQLPTVLAFTLTVTDAYGLASAPVTTVVTVGDVPVVGLEAANSSPNTLGETTWFTATITMGSNVTYRWNFDDGQMGSGRTISHTYGAMDIYTAVVTASNTTGEVSAFTVVRVEQGARLVFLPLVVKAGARATDGGTALIDARGM